MNILAATITQVSNGYIEKLEVAAIALFILCLFLAFGWWQEAKFRKDLENVINRSKL